MIPESMFFALVSDCYRDTLYMGYGHMCPQGKYVLVDLDGDKDMVFKMWIGELFGNGPFVDITRDFDVKRDLFDPPYHADKRDWEEPSAFTIISRLIIDPVLSLEMLVQIPDTTIQTALLKAEAEARTIKDQQESYERLSEVHSVRGGLQVAAQQLKTVGHRQSTADMIREKLKKLKGGS